MLGLSAVMPRQADKRSKYTTSLQVLLMQQGIQAGLCDQLPNIEQGLDLPLLGDQEQHPKSLVNPHFARIAGRV